MNLHSFLLAPLRLALTCFYVVLEPTKRGFWDKSLGLQYLLVKPPCPCAPLVLYPELHDQGYCLSPSTSHPSISHPPNPLASPDANDLWKHQKISFPLVVVFPQPMAANQTSGQQPHGESHYLGSWSSPILCPHSSAIPKNSVNLCLHGPELPFPQLNEAWICSSKGFAIVFYGPCCGMVLTQKLNSSFSLPLPHSLYVYISNGFIRTATREF